MSSAYAQSSEGASYDKLIDSALTEYRLAHWAEAKAYFAQAHALQPNARTLRGLGLVCYELRKYVESIGYFEESLTNKSRPLTDSMRTGVEQLLRDAQRFVTRVDVTLSPNAATLTLDGRPVVRDAQGRVLIDAGSHEFAADAEGHMPATRTVSTDGGEQIELSMQLLPSPPSSAPATAAAPAVQLQPSAAADANIDEGESPWPWVVVGVSGAVMIAGGVLLAVAIADKSKIENAPPDEQYWTEVESAYDRVPVYSTAGAIMLGVGAAGVAAGLAWKFWPDDDERASLRVVPNGLQLRAAF
ncbi:MAG TPA: hypothetical protein VJV78_30640 [Polyangiales bacterium]|nr:hypothetical protein [Polyangiales bacterium]